MTPTRNLLLLSAVCAALLTPVAAAAQSLVDLYNAARA